MYRKYCSKLIWIATLSIGLSGVAMAAETEVVPSLVLRQEYTDNLFYSSTGKVGTYITRATTGIKATGRTELFTGLLNAKATGLHYTVNKDMDDVEQLYEGSGSYRLAPRLKLSGSAAYRQESQPDRDIENSGQTLNVTSWHQSYGTSAEYQVGDLTAGILSYGNEQIAYSNHTNFSSVISHSASLGLEHDASRLLPLLKLRGTTNYSRSDYETMQVENYQLTVGASRHLHELWLLSLDAGGRYTRTGFQALKFDPISGFVMGKEHNDSIGWVLKTTLDYRGEMLQGSLAYSRDVNNSSGQFGTAVERDAVNLYLRRRINYELSAVLGAGYYSSKAGKNQFGSQEVNENSWRGSLGLRYEFNRSIVADLGYDYFHGENDNTGTAVNRNKVFFQLTAQTTLFE